jgi:hypothetical protein
VDVGGEQKCSSPTHGRGLCFAARSRYYPPRRAGGNHSRRAAHALQRLERIIGAPKRADRDHRTEMTSMPMLCKTFPTEVSARRAVAALRATGPPGRDLRLLTGRPLRDIRQEPVGEYARPLGHDAPVGTFGGGVVRRRDGASAFAGDPDQQRQGSFGDVDRVVIVSSARAARARRLTGRIVA